LNNLNDMRFTSLFAVALPFAALVQAKTIMVMVGQNAMNTYTPTSVMAAVNDVISFQFVSDNHTVTQSTFMTPCAMMPMGSDTGFNQVVAAGATTFPTYNYTVATTSPLWFYCRQGTHCQQGMVFAVNPTANETYATFQAKAMSTSTMMSSSMTYSSTSTMPSTTHSGALGLYGGSAAVMATLSGLVAGLFLQ